MMLTAASAGKEEPGAFGTRRLPRLVRRGRAGRAQRSTEDGIWSIYFNTALLATVDERDYIIRG